MLLIDRCKRIAAANHVDPGPLSFRPDVHIARHRPPLHLAWLDTGECGGEEDLDEPDLRLHRPGRPGHRRRHRHGAGDGAHVRQSGASVVLADLDGDLAAKEAERIVIEGGTAIGIACDVADEAQVAAMVDRAVAEYGRLDMAFNNAGIQVPPSDAADEPIEHFERVTAVNQRGVWACMKHELRVMREQGSGAIVNCSSLGGLVGLPQRAAYHGTKHAVLGMTKSAGVEYAPRGIRINAVCPGTIDTPMVADMLEGQADAMAEIMKQQSIGRLGRAEEVAAAVLWLCSPGASFVIGVGLPVDGGFTAH